METALTPALPETVGSEAALDHLLARPRPALVAFIRTVSSPLIILGAGGKMGPTLAALARRAAEAAGHKLEVIAVSRFSNANARRWLEERGVKTITADLLRSDEARRLPDAENLIFMVGLKFGTSESPALTWAINTLVPAHAMQRYARSRITALSTGNVYPLTPVKSAGSDESDSLTPHGEYSNATVGRERIFEFYSRQDGTPVVLLRLFYATELRYGVLRDIADRIWTNQPVDLTSGHFNCIWQGDANEMILRSLPLAASPPTAFNLTSPEMFLVRTVAERLGELLDRPVRFAGAESDNALLGNTTRLRSQLGAPPTPLDAMLRWTAHWVKTGGRSLGKPTHFDVRDGRY